MCRVSKKARIADSAAYSLCTAAPLPFGYLHFADIVDAALLTTLSPVSLHKSVSQPFTPLVCSCIMSFESLHAHFCLGSMVGGHHACSPAHWQYRVGSFSCTFYRTVPSALVNSYFFISYFVLAYTYLFSAKLRSGCLF